jgi:hypothetical protein
MTGPSVSYSIPDPAPLQAGPQVLPGAEDADEGGAEDADVGMF